MNEIAGCYARKTKSECPKHQQYYYNCPKHNLCLLEIAQPLGRCKLGYVYKLNIHIGTGLCVATLNLIVGDL